jgi:Tetratricopeptide repeat
MEAVELDEKVLEVCKRTLGVEHPDTLTSMSSLAISYRNQGRLMEAVENVLEVCKRTLGVEHPEILESMDNLAVSY